MQACMGTANVIRSAVLLQPFGPGTMFARFGVKQRGRCMSYERWVAQHMSCVHHADNWHLVTQGLWQKGSIMLCLHVHLLAR